VNHYLFSSLGWPLHCLTFSRLAIVLPYLISVGHCTALPHFGWPLYCLTFSRLAIVLPYLLSVGHCTALPHLGWPLYCLNLLNLPLLRSLFVLFSRLDIVLPYLPQLTTSDIIICFNLSVGHCTALPSLGWPLYWPTFLNLPLLIMPLVSSNFSFRQIFY
jgi:hypothetical protein